MKHTSNKEKFDDMVRHIGLTTVMIHSGELVTREIKETLTFKDWKTVFVQAAMEKDVKPTVRREAFNFMFKKAQTPEEWITVYGYTKFHSHEEEMALRKLCNDSFVTIEDWNKVGTTIWGTPHCIKKVYELAARRICEMRDKK